MSEYIKKTFQAHSEALKIKILSDCHKRHLEMQKEAMGEDPQLKRYLSPEGRQKAH